MARGKARKGSRRGVVGATRVGFGVLGVAYGCWGAGRAGQTMLEEAMWLPTKTPPSPTVRKVQRGVKGGGKRPGRGCGGRACRFEGGLRARDAARWYPPWGY